MQDGKGPVFGVQETQIKSWSAAAMHGLREMPRFAVLHPGDVLVAYPDGVSGLRPKVCF